MSGSWRSSDVLHHAGLHRSRFDWGLLFWISFYCVPCASACCSPLFPSCRKPHVSDPSDWLQTHCFSHVSGSSCCCLLISEILWRSASICSETRRNTGDSVWCLHSRRLWSGQLGQHAQQQLLHDLSLRQWGAWNLWKYEWAWVFFAIRLKLWRAAHAAVL